MGKLKIFKNDSTCSTLLNECMSFDKRSSCQDYIDKLIEGGYNQYFEDQNLIERPETIFIPSVKELIEASPKNNQFKHAEAAILLYEGLKLEPWEATDKRLWTYLAQGPYRDYCLNLLQRGGDGKLTFKKIKDRLFYEGRGQQTPVRNYIARLWWGVHISKKDNEEGESKYNYTRILLNHSQIFQDLTDRFDFATNKELLFALLDFIKVYGEIKRKSGMNISENDLSKAISPILLNELKFNKLKFSQFTQDDFSKKFKSTMVFLENEGLFPFQKESN